MWAFTTRACLPFFSQEVDGCKDPNGGARLTTETNQGIPGKVVVFSYSANNSYEPGQEICTGTTDVDGFVGCDALPAPDKALPLGSFTATFAGDSTYAGSSASAPFYTLPPGGVR
jgi:hypothetical protein